MLAENAPIPLPPVALVLAVVGAGLVFQTIPFSVTGVSPSEIISPPLVAWSVFMLVTAVVVTLGIFGSMVTSHPSNIKINPKRRTRGFFTGIRGFVKIDQK